MSKRIICMLLAVGFAFGVFFGSAIGYVIGGNDGVNQAVKKMEESRVFETCVSKETSEIDVTLFPTLPVFEKTQENLLFKPFDAFTESKAIVKEKKFETEKRVMYKITTQYEDKDGNIFQSTRIVDKDTYDSIKEGDSVYFDSDNNVEVK